MEMNGKYAWIAFLFPSVLGIEDISPDMFSLKMRSMKPINLYADPALHTIPEGTHPNLIHPYFKHPDFEPMKNVFDTHIGVQDSQFGFYAGPGLHEIDPLERSGPLGPDGPIRMKDTPFLTPLYEEPKKLFKPHFSGMWEEDFGDPGSFRHESLRQFSMGSTEQLGVIELKNPMNTESEKRPKYLGNSRFLRFMNAGVDEQHAHPSEMSKIAQMNGPVFDDVSLTQSFDTNIVSPNTGFEAERHEIRLPVAPEPCAMHLQRALSWKSQPLANPQLAPPVMTGVCIGIRCKDGVVLATDTTVRRGEDVLFNNVRRLHKVSDRILIAAEGEYSDFQEIQTMLMDLVDEHYDMLPQGFHDVEPHQAHYFMAKAMYERRNQNNPLWAMILLAGWGQNLDLDEGYPAYLVDEAPMEPFLGSVDMHGTPYKDHILATGMGSYTALPLLRHATDEVENFEQSRMPRTLTVAEAKRVAVDTMRVLYLRSSYNTNRIQLGIVTAEGVEITKAFYVEGEWTFDGLNGQDQHYLFQDDKLGLKLF